ncbi:MAG TPA: hypothetical protein PK202_13810 [Verrucomicrobiota bacterium]|jgi:hypothetical protein|nr:hypothetical protein [Verrucomicrobiota bacterium]OQC26012.1 MAG: hypothetical protein BWX68_01084 [Verrucomicrobia bacterium ADurb.Bin063]HNW08032.1 hypothetical protein [Verrucomicrobiota bacterium]HNZ76197.1 hypothetical protein [Verrucomicrobiota bacterium]HOH39217.1 hypothetical protein [Verrucomicrobiota bacterium]
MKPTKTDLRVVRCAERLAEWNAGRQGEEGGDDCPCRAVVTREGLAGVLVVSVRTVDEMVAKGEITPMRPGGVLVRFYLPAVLRQLTAAAVARLEKMKGGL